MIRIGVVGAGRMGSNHIRVLEELAAKGFCDFRGYYDPFAKGPKIAADSLGELLTQVDAVVVATPTSTHFDVAHRALGWGKHVLIEKPITETLEQADILISLAQRKGSVLQVGHIERFNEQIKYFLVSPRSLYIERIAPSPGRESDGSVVRDLMVHDIDLALFLTGANVQSVLALGTPDDTTSELLLSDGTIVLLRASRGTGERYRVLRCGHKAVDLLDNQNSLTRELHAFLAAISGKKRGRAASGEDGRKALAVALTIEACLI
jgi:predicted dehydrogenase